MARRVKGQYGSILTELPYSERSMVEPEVVAAYRAAALEEQRLDALQYDARRRRWETEAKFALQLDEAARFQVRQAHRDWFHDNGNKRGTFAKRIDAEVQRVRDDLWRELVPETAPKVPPTKEDRQAWYDSLKEQQAREWREILANEDRPEMVRRARAAKAALDAVRDQAGTPEWRAAFDTLSEVKREMRTALGCERCHKLERFTLDSEQYHRYSHQWFTDGGLHHIFICDECLAAERRERLAVGRRERQAAQRRARMRVARDDDDNA